MQESHLESLNHIGQTTRGTRTTKLDGGSP